MRSRSHSRKDGKGCPTLRAESEEGHDDDSELDEDCSRARMSFAMLCFILLIHFPVTIAAMESQIETMQNSINALKNYKEKKSKDLKKKDSSTSTPPTASKAEKPLRKRISVLKKAQILDDNAPAKERS